MEKRTLEEEREELLENNKKHLSDEIIEAIKVARKLSEKEEALTQWTFTSSGSGMGNGNAFRNS